MFRCIFIAFFVLLISKQNAQTVFWTETFNNGCTAGCTSFTGTAGNGAWTFTNNGTNGPFPNKWYISCAENGMAVGSCGAGCGSNATMHIGNDPNSDCGCFVCPTGDCGAAYDACDGLTFCGGSPQTNKRAISPLISTVGRSGISVSFDYIEGGQGSTDDGIAYFSTNAGTTWSLLVNTNKTATGCGGQGIWANFTSTVLPSTCDNNANFRISFVWINNADGLGSDPSYAINDLRIRYTTLLPVELSKFTAEQNGSGVQLNWTTESEKNFSCFEIQKSEDAINFICIGKLRSSGNNHGETSYQFNDAEYNHGMNYYRLKMIDLDGSYKFSELVLVDESNTLHAPAECFLNAENNIVVREDYIQKYKLQGAQIIDLSGKIVCKFDLINKNENGFAVISCSALTRGLYFCQLTGEDSQKSFKFVIGE